MPTISWHRQREGREVFGAALMKTPMKTFGGLRRWARSRGGPLDWFDVGLLCRLFFFAAECGALDASTTAVEKVWAISELEKTGEGKIVKHCDFEI